MMKSLIAFAIAIGLAVYLKYKLAIVGTYLIVLGAIILCAYVSGMYDGEVTAALKERFNHYHCEYKRGKAEA